MATSSRKVLHPTLEGVGTQAQAEGRVLWRSLALASLCLVVGFLFTFRLESWPYSWFDEGLNLAAAGTLATDGTYGLPDSAGARVMDPAIQTGPTVIVPIALVFKLAGVGLLQARIVMVVFAVFALAMAFLLAQRLTGTTGALLVAGLLLVGNGDYATSFVPLGRQVLGEAPVFGMFCLGARLLIRHIDRPESSALFAGGQVGLVFGLAMLTKSQMALLLPVAVGLLWIANLLYYRVIKWWLPILILAVSCGIVLCWYGVQLAYVGFDGYQQNSEVLREGFSIHIARLSLTGSENAARALWSTGYLFWGVPGLVYCAWLARSRTKESFVYVLPLLLTCVWLGWYTLLSIGWSRYAALPLMISTLFTARLIVDALQWRLTARATRLPGIRGWGAREPLAILAVAVVLAVSLLGGLREMVGVDSQGREEMIAYLQREIPADSTIETWAWELDVFTPQRLHHPPTGVTNVYTREIWDGLAVPANAYDPGTARPDFVLANSFSTWTGIYEDYIAERGALLFEAGEYRLYAIRQE